MGGLGERMWFMPELLCKVCGKFYTYGKPHDCLLSPTIKSPSPTVSPTLKVPMKEVLEHKRAMSGWERNKKWREKHREEYNAGMRNYRKRTSSGG